ncbi:alpha/beta hydrolase family protein [Sandarakinorhabdus limnophila]|uniref:alpha/beta hydrolase family protein n=1 Tax=Sandarakinorhabdus limnophila TaxID=210512 RepID=UPI0026EFCAED|nr:alpha/beta fold hydrolase [Sandarakinorhabdus limnophila]MCM0033079.1 alpha/beta fold hydrolase [Sandarakinorhabdus limnophila]
MRSLVLALLLMSAPALANPLFTDPPATATPRARMEVLHIPSGGVEINGVAYLAAGPGPHPTIVICHGWPGNEKNLDLAQALRRAGWNAVTFNYRGAWGSPGAFRFGQNPEDAKAVLAMLRKPEVAAKLGIDTRRIVLAGHSMGGWVTGMVASEDQALAGAILISAANMGMAAQMAGDRLEAQAAGSSEALAGTSPALQAAELRAQAAAFDLRPRAAGLARQPLLVLTSDDGLKPATDPLVAAARAAGGKVTEAHQATDHSWSDARIALATSIHDWLATLPARR